MLKVGYGDLGMIDKPYLVRDVMTKNPVTVSLNETVWDAVVKMDALGVGALPVVDDNGRVVGIFTERDLLRRVVAKKKDPQKTLISEVMTRNPVTVKPTDTIKTAKALMAKIKARHLPVVDDDGKIVGIVSIKDIEFVEP